MQSFNRAETAQKHQRILKTRISIDAPQSQKYVKVGEAGYSDVIS